MEIIAWLARGGGGGGGGGEGEGTSLYKPYRYVPPQRECMSVTIISIPNE